NAPEILVAISNRPARCAPSSCAVLRLPVCTAKNRAHSGPAAHCLQGGFASFPLGDLRNMTPDLSTSTVLSNLNQMAAQTRPPQTTPIQGPPSQDLVAPSAAGETF